MAQKIQDEFTDLPVTCQRKYQVHHPERHRAAEERYRQSAAGKRARSEINRRYREKSGDKRRLTHNTDLLISKHSQFADYRI
jgi:hypothetical protein